MVTTPSIVVALTAMFWLGMVVAISFLETPLKFRAQGVTLEIGLAIGRLVFHALNAVECVLAAVLIATIGWLARDDSYTVDSALWVGAGVAIGALLLQRFMVRPVLDQRLDARLRGDVVAPSRHHLVYIGLEFAKLAGLITLVIVVATTGDAT